ncbi:unnamed protein product, partial [Musa acuminata var. zebrina]
MGELDPWARHRRHSQMHWRRRHRGGCRSDRRSLWSRRRSWTHGRVVGGIVRCIGDDGIGVVADQISGACGR